MKNYIMRLLSLILTVTVLFGMICGLSGFANAGAIPATPNSTNENFDGLEDDDFVPGEVLSPADSQEHAEEIASAYGLKLESYAWGVAVLAAPNPEQEVVDSKLARGRSARRRDMPELSVNRIYTLYDTSKRSVRELISEQKPFAVPSNAEQWQHEEMDTERAWSVTRGAGVVVAVIDTGIDTDHPAFAGRILPNAYNSYTNQVGLEHVRDDHGHGSHVSGIVAASPETGTEDVSGVAPDARILTIKANKPSAGSFETASLVRGINYASANGADIINLSLGLDYSSGSDDLEHDAIINAVRNNVTIVCAAGNGGGWDRHASFPAAYPETVAVSSLRQGGVFDDSYSDYGPEIDVSAPGTDIYSVRNGGGYVQYTGTSMASPNAAGVAALIKAENPEFSPEQVRTVLCGTAKKTPDMETSVRNHYYGYGSVNAYAAVQVNELHAVTYDFNDGIHTPLITYAVPGSKLFEPTFPERTGFVFDYWSFDKEGKNRFNFEPLINENIMLYAQWFSSIIPNTFAFEFPDANLRQEVLRLLNMRDNVNRSSASVISIDDSNTFTTMNSLNLMDLGIKRLKGVERFTDLKSLNCRGNQLTQLDVTNYTAMTYLDCSNNQLRELDVSGNTALEFLDCSFNELAELNVSNNVELTTLDCSKNYLTELNVSNNTLLSRLSCNLNNLLSEDYIIGLSSQLIYYSFDPQRPAITILRHPKTLTFVEHNDVTEQLDVYATSSYGAVSYQWYSNTSPSNSDGTPVKTGGNTRTLSIPKTLPIGTYYYYCEIKTSMIWRLRTITSSVTSDVATVVVEERVHAQVPDIAVQPRSENITVGGEVSLSVMASATTDGGTLSYQWYGNTTNRNSGGMMINGETNAKYSPSTATAGKMYYYVVVTNTIHDNGDHGRKTVSVTSDTCTVTVNATPTPTPGRKKGDVNGNGEIDLRDVRLALKATLSLIRLTGEEFKAADLYDTGEITLDEVRTILRASLGLVDLEKLLTYRDANTKPRFGYETVKGSILLTDSGKL